MDQTSSLEDAASQLSRLTSRPTVLSTLILSGKDGSIIRSTGLLSQTNHPDATTTSEETYSSSNNYTNGEREPTQSAEKIARLTWSFVQASQALMDGVEGKEGLEAKLMRLRSDKKEIVVYPDPKYLLVVVHKITTT